MEPFDPYDRKRSNIFRHPGFRFGFLGALLTILLHQALPFISRGEAWGEGLAWVLQWAIYYFTGRSAAQQQYNAQQNGLDAMRGVQGAGVGAGLVTSLLTWIFILIRAIVLYESGTFVIIEPISMYCIVVIDVCLAIALGAAAGRSIANKYRTFSGY